MAGNAAEWVADELEIDPGGAAGRLSPSPEPAIDPRPKTGAGGFHVIRGGSYEDGAGFDPLRRLTTRSLQWAQRDSNPQPSDP